jgi:hypothetical protein
MSKKRESMTMGIRQTINGIKPTEAERRRDPPKPGGSMKEKVLKVGCKK